MAQELAAQVIGVNSFELPGEPSGVDRETIGQLPSDVCVATRKSIPRLISGRALGQEVPGMVINRYCASGLEAISLAVGKIKAGMAHCIIAGGAECMSLVPMLQRHLRSPRASLSCLRHFEQKARPNAQFAW